MTAAEKILSLIQSPLFDPSEIPDTQDVFTWRPPAALSSGEQALLAISLHTSAITDELHHLDVLNRRQVLAALESLDNAHVINDRFRARVRAFRRVGRR